MRKKKCLPENSTFLVEELVSERQSTKALMTALSVTGPLYERKKFGDDQRDCWCLWGITFYIGAPVRFAYGYNLHVGHNFYAKSALIFLDDMPIVIGNNVMLGPRVSLFTASHH